MSKCLFNTYSDNIVGHCDFHRCDMTTKQMKCKNCLGKNCRHFQKNDAHPYWIEREVMKNRRKKRKQKINDYVEQFKEV